jgi:hypothetical protein
MFGAEPREVWSNEEAREFEEHASARLRACGFGALKAAAAFGLSILCIVPFSAGHRLHGHWATARYLVWIAMALWLWLVVKVALVWGSWQSTREIRREFSD